jgi:hypothetical protein
MIMDGVICYGCKKPMGNSLTVMKVLTIGQYGRITEIRVHIHKKCMETKYGNCVNCLSMDLRNVHGECGCGKMVD